MQSARPRADRGSVGANAARALRGAWVPRPGQLLNIYRKDCVIRLPFLRLAIVSPEALLSHDGADAELQETLSYLCEDESEVGRKAWGVRLPRTGVALTRRRRARRVARVQVAMPTIPYMTAPLGNLLRTLAFQRRLGENEPMRPKELELNSRIVAELNVTAKTAFRL